jgi:diguanylate cyclase
MSDDRPPEAAFPAPEVPDAISPRTPRLPGHELVVAISQLDQAIHNHLQWHENLIRVLVTRLSPEVSDLRPDAHRRCRFGQWYDSGAGVELHNQPAFIAVGEAHQRMHTSATRLLGRTDADTRVTASFGLAALDRTRPVEETIEQADAAMYRAKSLGRDRVEVFEGSDERS